MLIENLAFGLGIATNSREQTGALFDSLLRGAAHGFRRLGFAQSLRPAFFQLAAFLLQVGGVISDDAQVALEGYRYSFRATEDLYKNGLASLLQLEDVRRTRLAADARKKAEALGTSVIVEPDGARSATR